METDEDAIKRLGGPAELAKKLNFPKKNGTQRVNNWKTRGIPARVKLDHPSLFAVGANKVTSDAEREAA